MNNEEEIMKQIKVLIQYAKDHEHTEITATEVNTLELLLDLYSNKKEEMYAIAKANYDVGMLEERSQWYKKINKKREKINEEYKSIESEYTEEEINDGDENLDDYVQMQAIQYADNILEELIGKEE